MTRERALYDLEILQIAEERGKNFCSAFIAEVERLLGSGALNDKYSRGVVFGVAIKNIVANYFCPYLPTRQPKYTETLNIFKED